MRDKYIKGAFGVCPRVLCERQHTLPIGMSEEIRTSRVKIFCPRCQEVYMPKKKCHDIDGAYFGCSFANILLMVYPDLLPKASPTTYVPKVYGFKVYGRKGSKYELKEEKKEITYYTQ
jgi:casein kinase II subunit beta